VTIRVLLADDHAVLRDGLKVLLQQAADISVVGVAADGREAVRRAQELKPDVVIMDIAMRELNGIEAARLLRDQCPATRVVMLSMHSDSEHVFRALEAGAAGFVLKESAGEEVAADGGYSHQCRPLGKVRTCSIAAFLLNCSHENHPHRDQPRRGDAARQAPPGPRHQGR